MSSISYSVNKIEGNKPFVHAFLPTSTNHALKKEEIIYSKKEDYTHLNNQRWEKWITLSFWQGHQMEKEIVCIK